MLSAKVDFWQGWNTIDLQVTSHSCGGSGEIEYFQACGKYDLWWDDMTIKKYIASWLDLMWAKHKYLFVLCKISLFHGWQIESKVGCCEHKVFVLNSHKLKRNEPKVKGWVKTSQ